MLELATVANVITALAVAAAAIGFQPVTAGAFWAIISLYGLVSIFFDDETPRGIPGLDVIQEHLSRREGISKGQG
jgi:hypothetical protein